MKPVELSPPLSVFISYAHEDEALLHQLEAHLSLLRRQGWIDDWHDRQLLAGEEWAQEIDEHLEKAWIILLLISPDFLASDYCYDKEMKRALELHQHDEARVLPIILRPCDWQTSPFAHLQCLPWDGKAVTIWQNPDEAFLTITNAPFLKGTTIWKWKIFREEGAERWPNMSKRELHRMSEKNKPSANWPAASMPLLIGFGTPAW